MKRILIAAAMILAFTSAHANQPQKWFVIASVQGRICTPLNEVILGAYTPEDALRTIRSVGMNVQITWITSNTGTINDGGVSTPLPFTSAMAYCDRILPFDQVRDVY